MSPFRERLRAEWSQRRRSIQTAALASATLGLAPFQPAPHVYKQLVNLVTGQLRAPIDVFDLALHGAPWVWLLGLLGAWIAAARRPPVPGRV